MSNAPVSKGAIATFIENVAAGKAALQKATTDLAAMTAKVEALEASAASAVAERDVAVAALAAKSDELVASAAKVSALDAALSSVATALGFKPAELSAKSPADLQASLQGKVKALATEQLAELGFDPAKLPAPAAASSGSAKDLTYAEFSAMPPAAKMEFCLKGGRIVDNPLAGN